MAFCRKKASVQYCGALCVEDKWSMLWDNIKCNTNLEIHKFYLLTNNMLYCYDFSINKSHNLLIRKDRKLHPYSGRESTPLQSMGCILKTKWSFWPTTQIHSKCRSHCCWLKHSCLLMKLTNSIHLTLKIWWLHLCVVLRSLCQSMWSVVLCQLLSMRTHGLLPLLLLSASLVHL